MSKLKVVQLLPELNIGGVERGTKDFSEALVQRGHKSIVISNGGLFEQDIINAGCIHLKLPIHKKNPISFLQVKELVRVYKEYEPDIVHIRSIMPAWINYYAFKKLDNKPILLSTFHGLYSTPIYSKIMARVDHTIAISKTVRDYIKNTYSVEDKNITIIPRGCDPLLFNKIKPDINWLNRWYEEFPQTKNKIILTLPTRISQWKGVDSFIDLIADINNDSFHALVVGPTSKKKKKYLNDLKAKIKDKGLGSLITFTGSRSDISNIYKISDIVYNLSVKPEPFGRTTIEAIASGSKVMGWNHGGTKEILEELYPEGLVELNNIAQLKQQTLIISKENYEKPKENTFLSSKLIDSTIQLYQDLLKASS